MNRAGRRRARRTRCKYFTRPYKNGRSRERARLYYFPPKEKQKYETQEANNG